MSRQTPVLGSPDTDIVSVPLATDVECGFIGEDQSSSNLIRHRSNLEPRSLMFMIHVKGLLSLDILNVRPQR
jgi:hypothetical protein